MLFNERERFGEAVILVAEVAMGLDIVAAVEAMQSTKSGLYHNFCTSVICASRKQTMPQWNYDAVASIFRMRNEKRIIMKKSKLVIFILY